MPACPVIEGVMSNSIIDDLKKMINDNYMLFGLYFILMGVFGYALYYVTKDAIKVVMDYRKNSKISDTSSQKNSPLQKSSDNQLDPTADNEYYPTDAEAPRTMNFDNRKPKDYRVQNTKDFYNKLDKQYDDYNTQKSTYIKQVYQGRKIDDIIDDKVEYPQYDDYAYTKPQDAS